MFVLKLPGVGNLVILQRCKMMPWCIVKFQKVCFLHFVTISQQKKTRSWDFGVLLLSFLRVMYDAQYIIDGYTSQSFEQLGAPYMRN